MPLTNPTNYVYIMTDHRKERAKLRNTLRDTVSLLSNDDLRRLGLIAAQMVIDARKLEDNDESRMGA